MHDTHTHIHTNTDVHTHATSTQTQHIIYMQMHTHTCMYNYTHVCTDDNKSLYHKQHKLSKKKFYDSLDFIQIQRKICDFNSSALKALKKVIA